MAFLLNVAINSFIGSNQFCMTVCDPNSSTTDQDQYCQNIYDELGCKYNAPANVQNGTFVSCEADNKTPVGIYTSNGATRTYTQPASGAVTTVPYTPVIPQSSNCVTFQSAELYSNQPLPTSGSSSSVPAGATTAAGSSASASRAGSAGGASQTGTSGAGTLAISSVASIAGVVFAMAFLS